MLLWGAHDGGLELRRDGRGKGKRLRGRFPYGKRAVLSDGGKTGRPRKEVIAPRAFAYRVDRPGEDIHFLVGHDYDRPLASRGADTLSLQDTAEALTFDALITVEMQETTWAADFLRSFAAGLILGLSPGFRIPPPRTVPDAETVEEEDPREGDALIRTIFAALLYELSAVTVPAYKDAGIEERNWIPTRGGLHLPEDPRAGLHRSLSRWRA
jgi:HK97 family phage prohead protease